MWQYIGCNRYVKVALYRMSQLCLSGTIQDVLDYVNENTGYLISYTLTPVFGMPWSPYYKGDQLWAEPDVYHAAKLMRHVYNNREEAKQKGIALQRNLRKNFNYDVLGDKFIYTINKILEEK